jgi:long-chain acyl-CoA synthetase
MLTLNTHLERIAHDHGESPALIEASTGFTLSHRAFFERLHQVFGLLESAEVAPGEVVTLMSPNSIDMSVMLIGAMAYGAIANPLNPALSAREIDTLLQHSGSRTLFAPPGRAPSSCPVRVRDLAEYMLHSPPLTPLSKRGVSPEDGALLIYTSGTTGSPKGVLLSHQNLTANVETAIQWFGLDERHRTLCILPLFHTFGLVSDVLPMLFTGGAAVVSDIFDVTKIKAIDQAIERHQVRSFSAVPLMFDMFLRLGSRLGGGSMKFCVAGAAPLLTRTLADFSARFGFPIIPAYGMTETTCFCTISPPQAIVAGSSGVPARMQVRVVDERGEDLPHGQIGELVARGDNVIRGGYFRDDRGCFLDPQRTWFMTGDLGYIDEKGYVYVTGRKKNMVIRGGEKVYLEDLDRCLSRLADVADSATVGVTQGSTERIVCFIVRERDTLGEARVMEHLRAEVGDAKSPDRVVFCESIPRTATNKVKIAELQALALERV